MLTGGVKFAKILLTSYVNPPLLNLYSSQMDSHYYYFNGYVGYYTIYNMWAVG